MGGSGAAAQSWAAGPIGMGPGSSLQVSPLLRLSLGAASPRAGPDRRSGWVLHPSAPWSQPATVRKECKCRKSESRGKGTEDFTAVYAVSASVFVSRFLCDWRFVYTKIDGFPTRLP